MSHPPPHLPGVGRGNFGFFIFPLSFKILFGLMLQACDRCICSSVVK